MDSEVEQLPSTVLLPWLLEKSLEAKLATVASSGFSFSSHGDASLFYDRD